MKPRASHQARSIILFLAASVALMTTGYGLIMPVFARRLEELGGGVQQLGLMTMAFAAGAFLAAPFMGSLADRLGRRPLVLLALTGLVLTNLAFLLTQSFEVIIAVRFIEGAITAGLLPASMGIIADTVPEDQRARWIGFVMSSYGAGLIFGPTVGGLLYEAWGYAAPFLASAAMALAALLFAAVMLPETRPASARAAATSLRTRMSRTEILASLPRPLSHLGLLLVLDFVAVFTFTFVEPQMIFYLYDELGFSTTQFGVLIGTYGLATVVGPALLGGLSDRFGRKPVIALGFMLNVAFYLGLALVTRFALTLFVAIVAGIGVALINPALSAAYLDITAEAHRARVMGIKESAVALGGVLGPLLVALASRWAVPQQIFLISAGVTVVASILALGVQPARPGTETGTGADALIPVPVPVEK